MTFDILQHLDQLKPDGGHNNPRGDHSFHCPVCEAPNFKVNVANGKWGAYGCECSSTEEGKRAIRQALSPARPPGQDRPLNLQVKSTAPQGFAVKSSPKPAAKPASKKAIRPHRKREWRYDSKEGRPILKVHRKDDGQGNRKIWQRSLVDRLTARDVQQLVVPYNCKLASLDLQQGAPYVFWVEGEPCVDAFRELGLPAVTSLRGCEGFDPTRDGGHFDPTRVVVVPDQDACGMKYARKVAAAYPGCRWLLPYPGTAEWNGAMPNDGGLDVADWIADGATAEEILEGVLEANPFEDSDSDPEPVSTPVDEWDLVLQNLVDPEHPCFERNPITREIRANTAASQLRVRATPEQVRQKLRQKQKDRIADTSVKGVAGGEVVPSSERKWLIQTVIPEGCLVAVAAKIKCGKTILLTELVASLIHQVPFMGNPDWLPAPGRHRLILWWTDQPRVDSCQYLKARGLMQADGTLHPQIVRLYTEEDDIDWGDQGLDELIQITTANPGAILLTDSFYANVRSVYGSDQDASVGGALIDIQSTVGPSLLGHVCAFHAPQDSDAVGFAAIRGHGSAKGVPSACLSLHFLEKRSPNGRWVEDKENPHRRMVMEGRMGYWELLVRLSGAEARWEVIGPYEESLANLQADSSKAEALERLTQGQRETLEYVGCADAEGKGVTAAMVANAKSNAEHGRDATPAEIQVSRKQLKALQKDGLLSKTKTGNSDLFSFRGG
jgi:hypothetical protein